MYTRLLQIPETSIFLFGPRGTGKSTWIGENFKNAVTYDFLDSQITIPMERNPHLLYDEVHSLPEGSWIILDEVQKIPALLDEVHRLIETKNLRFILCGSSARKLKRGGANLLAGRALMTQMFPLCSKELGKDFNVTNALQYGTLPMAISSNDPEGYLSAYTATYLNEEIRAEALTRNVGAFSRFLEIAARQNAQVTNTSNIARDSSTARTTVQNYFQILVDTLLGYWVYPWKFKPSTKQVSHPKFYLFDTGVARGLSGRLPYPPTQEELGPLMENLILNEIRAYLSYKKLRYEPHFWSKYSGAEVDFICETKTGFIALEIKAATQWQRQFNKGLIRIQSELPQKKVQCYGIFRGNRPARFDNITVLPIEEFLNSLWKGDVIQ